MPVRILEDTTGSVDHIHTQSYEEGEVLECDGRRMSEELAEILIDGGQAEWVGEDEARETKPAGPEETKPAGPEETAEDSTEGRWYETSGSWKTFYDADGWEVGKAQCSKEDAEAWVDGEISLDELTD